MSGGHRMPRPMGHQLLATQPFEVVAMDFMSMPKSRHGKKNRVLVVVDQLTRITLCVATKNKTV